MVSRIFLCLALLLALALAPQTSMAVPTKGVDKKTSSSKKSTKANKTCQVSKSSSRSAYKEKRSHSSSKRSSRRHSRDDDEDYADNSSSRGRSDDYSAADDFVPTYYKAAAKSTDDVFVPKYYKPGSRTASTESTPSYNSTPTRAGVLDSGAKPLMKVTPQRDGRFLLEPMSPKPKTGPNSKADEKTDNKAASGGRGYNLYEPWNFRDLVLTMAKGYQGTPYSMGASLEYGNSTDCSGFVQYIYKGFKINMPRSSCEQAEVGQTVTRSLDYSKLLPGDVLFFSRAGHSVGHTGIYLGDGKMIHASTYRTGVIITDLKEGNYDHRFVVAKRIFEVAYLK
jgi:cell wall-associated NlpC family hydrolase